MRDLWEAFRDLWPLALVGAILIVGLGALSMWLAASGCDEACALEDDRAEYLWKAGCWCIDENGHAYNPKDAR
jgi:hypothetical protein